VIIAEQYSKQNAGMVPSWKKREPVFAADVQTIAPKRRCQLTGKAVCDLVILVVLCNDAVALCLDICFFIVIV